ncbi:hypothetical protein SISNIDRAFT_536575 [Sistotremastrum niveocremeum HHB9708]|uniref:RING-type domain-containing protein n=1 Tax=Sistotremastrum niveocremeum HHB9708 TaxID=1314777 RepID=A0A164XSP9_9AGAM|nr:hypothetical protein SISNIDRAFT_536575 [Sistotremastrum niveocremeum HHB9708]
MGDLVLSTQSPLQEASSSNGSNKAKSQTLFGPGIGIMSSGPKWTESSSAGANAKGKMGDELTPEVVKAWVAKSKETSQPTTTLQALVNLKRPSIKLSPLTHPSDSLDPSNSNPQLNLHMRTHGLEFEFDADAPKCLIQINVVTPSSSSSESDESTPMLLFEKIVEGGFGRYLRIEDGAVLELDKLDAARSEDLAISPVEASPSSNIPTSASQSAGVNGMTPSASARTVGGAGAKKRFSNFHFLKRHGHGHNSSVAGPALQVVDAESSSMPMPMPDKTKEEKEKEEGGVKITIRLEALDGDERPLECVNSQVTYLHIVRLGPPPATNSSSSPSSSAPATSATGSPWIVKVVRREAVIGLHTFHLHEIYGLSSASAPTPTPTTTSPTNPPPTSPQHSYPPTSPTVTAPLTSSAHAEIDDDPTSECLLCLSSPREVVLLPCRHLVACKECAMNMVEFGAGGSLVHADSGEGATSTSPTDAPAGAGGEGGGGEGGSAATAAPTVTPTTTTTHRRKRKAKGWYCPVCRQPYTSLLRITTVPPEKDMSMRESTSADGDGESTRTAHPPEHDHEHEHAHAGNMNGESADPLGANGNTSGNGNEERPGFLRSISRIGARSA